MVSSKADPLAFWTILRLSRTSLILSLSIYSCRDYLLIISFFYKTEQRIRKVVEKIKERQGVRAAGCCYNRETKKWDFIVISKKGQDEEETPIRQLIEKNAPVVTSYDLYIRDINNEGMDVAQSSKVLAFFRKKGYSKRIFELEEKINKYVEDIIKDCPNVTSVSFSPVKSTGFGTSDRVLVEEPCIVFSVEVKFDKKRIPLGSKEIPKEINGVKTDIREGFVEPLMHQGEASVHLGCKIATTEQYGTLGPLFSSHDGKTGFISSLHVLLSTRELRELSSRKRMHDPVTTNRCVLETNTTSEIGTITEKHYEIGNVRNGATGYEFGLVELHSKIRIEEGMLSRISLSSGCYPFFYWHCFS